MQKAGFLITRLIYRVIIHFIHLKLQIEKFSFSNRKNDLNKEGNSKILLGRSEISNREMY